MRMPGSLKKIQINFIILREFRRHISPLEWSIYRLSVVEWFGGGCMPIITHATTAVLSLSRLLRTKNMNNAAQEYIPMYSDSLDHLRMELGSLG
jgi:hypothetical protein